MGIDVARTAGAGGRLIRNVLIGTGIVLATLAARPDRATPAGPVALGGAGSYGVLAAGSVAGTGEPTVDGDLGVYPGKTRTGFPPGVVKGAVRLGDPEARQAQNDLKTAYDDANRRTATAPVGPELAGRTLAPGVYRATESVTVNGTLTLDARNDPRAVFVFQLATGLSTAENSRIEVVNSPRPGCNVFWAVGNSVTLGPGSHVAGTLMAANSITARFATTISGRALSRSGDVKLESAAVRSPDCSADTGSPAPSVSGSGTSGSPSAGPTSGGPTRNRPSGPATPS